MIEIHANTYEIFLWKKSPKSDSFALSYLLVFAKVSKTRLCQNNQKTISCSRYFFLCFRCTSKHFDWWRNFSSSFRTLKSEQDSGKSYNCLQIVWRSTKTLLLLLKKSSDQGVNKIWIWMKFKKLKVKKLHRNILTFNKSLNKNTFFLFPQVSRTW